MVSVLFQEFNIYPFTIAENICLKEGKEGAEELSALYSLIGLSETIEKFENKDGTILDRSHESGTMLSGGEELRVAIARTLYSQTPMVILDEPSAALDPLAEFEFYKTFRELTEEKTTIFVSHRLASCAFSNKIIVFRKGQICGVGTHDELYRNNELYREMYTAQVDLYEHVQ
jgi:ABC-type multidrug transport system fused ATPase/permease subunit